MRPTHVVHSAGRCSYPPASQQELCQTFFPANITQTPPPPPHWTVQATVSAILQLQLSIPFTFYLLYTFSSTFYHITNYWIARFFNYALLRRPTELPLVLRPRSPGWTSPYWMTMHRIHDLLFAIRGLFFFWVAGLVYSVRILPAAWINFMFLWTVCKPLQYVLPWAMAAWVAWRIVAAVRAFIFYSQRSAKQIVQDTREFWLTWVWLFPALFILLVLRSIPVVEVWKGMWRWSSEFVADVLYLMGDGLMDYAGPSRASLERNPQWIVACRY